MLDRDACRNDRTLSLRVDLMSGHSNDGDSLPTTRFSTVWTWGNHQMGPGLNKIGTRTNPLVDGTGVVHHKALLEDGALQRSIVFGVEP